MVCISNYTSLLLLTNPSSAFRSSRVSKRGIYAVCFPLDELLVDEGNQCAKYYSDVGYISCEYNSIRRKPDTDSIRRVARLKVQTHSPSSTCTSAQHFSFDGARSFGKWTSRYVIPCVWPRVCILRVS